MKKLKNFTTGSGKKISEQTLDALRGCLRDYVERNTRPDPKHRKDYFCCPFCGSGTHGRADSDGDLHISADGKTWTCEACGRYGDIFDFVENLENITSFPEQIKHLSDLYGYPVIYEDGSREDDAIKRPNLNDTNASGQFTAEDPKIEIRANNDATDGKEPQPEEKKFNSLTEANGNTPGKYKDDLEADAAALWNTEDPEAVHALEYLTDGRGLEEKYLHTFNVGFRRGVYFNTPNKKTNAIIFPHSADASYYSARSLEGSYFAKPKKEDAGPAALFNPGALYQKQPVFIVEGEIDALSIRQCGGRAAAICGDTGEAALITAIKYQRPEAPLILALDNDDEPERKGDNPGQKSQERIKKELDELKVKYITASFEYSKYNGPHDDPNALMLTNPAQFKADIERMNEAALYGPLPEGFRKIDTGSYITGGMLENDIEYFEKYRDRKTGYKGLDRYLTLYPGLAALGGPASLGKTTFTINLCDNLVRRGESVIYFSLEQTAAELVTKSLARRLIERDPASPLTNIDIKNGATSDTLEAVKREYARETAGKFYIISCDFTVTAATIREYVSNYVKRTGKRPIIVIDYLQLVSPPEDFRGDTRAATDLSIKEFKNMQRENELLCILISSMNRASYSEPADFSDFKETGLVEYSCDYVWELQLSIMEDEEFYRRQTGNKSRETTKQERSDMIYQATTANPKDVEFVSLKSRNGTQRYKAFFKYDMKHDVYTETERRAYIDSEGEIQQAGEEKQVELPEDFQSVSTPAGVDKYGVTFT